MKTVNSNQNKVSFTCTKSATPELVKLLSYLEMLGLLGCTREIVIEDEGKYFTFDGDGPDQVSNIKVDGVDVDEWEPEPELELKMEMDD